MFDLQCQINKILTSGACGYWYKVKVLWNHAQTWLLPVILPICPWKLAPTKPDIWAPRLTPIKWMELKLAPWSWECQQQIISPMILFLTCPYKKQQINFRSNGYFSYLHYVNESCKVFCNFLRVLHCCQVIHRTSAVVPVHYYKINVAPRQQQFYDLVQPCWPRATGPISMNNKGSGPWEVELRMCRQVCVGQEGTTVAIYPGVEQQPNFYISAVNCVKKCQGFERVARLSYRWWKENQIQSKVIYNLTCALLKPSKLFHATEGASKKPKSPIFSSEKPVIFFSF